MLNGFGETWNKVSTDDHYAWILKTSQMLDCPDGKCRFIEDTRAQTKLDYANFSYERNLMRWREQHCLFDIYTPLYTVIMIIYKKAFNLVNWEQAYQAVSITGFAFCSIGALVFLVSLFGYLPAAIALLIMSVCKWGWLNFGIITPSFFVTGTLFWILTLFVKRPTVFLNLLGPFIVIMSLYHPIGKIYSAGLLMLAGFGFFENLVYNKRTQMFFTIAGICFLGVMALGFVEQPQFKLAAFPFVDGQEVLMHFLKNITALFELYSGFFNLPSVSTTTRGILSIGLILFIVYLVGRSNRRNIIGVLLVFYSAISIFHFFRNYPGELSGRIIIPLFVYLCGAIGVVITDFIQFTKWKRIGILVTIFLFATALSIRYQDPKKVFTLPESQLFLTAENNLYDPEQVHKVFDKDGNCGSVMYLDQTPMWVYSLYGSLKCGALIPYLWPLPNAEFKKMLKERKDLSHLVGLNPIYRLVGIPIIHPKRKLLVSFDQKEPRQLFLRFKGSETAAGVELLHVDGSAVIERRVFEIKPKSEVRESIWVKFGQQILINANTAPVWIDKASFSEKLNWTWGEPVKFSMLDINELGKPVKRFDMNFLSWQDSIEKFFNLKLEIVDDSKASILMTASLRSE